jgi:superfamily II DNA/RNA helicase
VCRIAGEISELLATKLAENDRGASSRFRLRAAALYALASMPAMAASVIKTGHTSESIQEFFAGQGRFDSLMAASKSATFTPHDGDLAEQVLDLLELDLSNLARYEHGESASNSDGNIRHLSRLAAHLSLGLSSTDLNVLETAIQLHQRTSVRNNVSTELFDVLSRYDFPVALFPAQIEAVQSGLLDQQIRGWGFAAPTGTGKTFLTRLLILDAVREQPDRSVIYLVPSRALVHEITSSLAKFFVGDSITVTAVTPQLIALDHEESERLRTSNVVVLTPEKADLLLRLGETFVQRAVLVIVDEAHHLESGTRGALLELYLLRLRQMVIPEPRIVLLSAVAPNIHELAGWAGENSRATVVTQRATRMRAGTYRLRSSNNKQKQGWVDYTNGTSLPIVTEKIESGVGRQLVQAAHAFSTAGPVLVVAKGKKECEHLAELMTQYQAKRDLLKPLSNSEADSEAFRRLESRLLREMYPDVPMRRLLRNRIAYHHAGLPPRVRIAVEDAIRARLVDFVFATTTLAEGVNFPFSTVIVQALSLREAPEKGQPVRYHAVTPRSFWNIAGRAGRPGVDREGQVILFEPTLGLERIKAVIDPYLDPNLMSLNPVNSALGGAVRQISEGLKADSVRREDLNREVLPASLPRSIHGAINLVRVALVHARTARIPSPEEIVTRTLAFRQASPVEQGFLKETFADQQRVLDEFFKDPLAPPPDVVSELGLSIQTLSEFRDYVKLLQDWQVEALKNVMRGGNANLNQAKFTLAPVAKRMAELEGRQLGGIYGEVATLWLSGIPLTQVRQSSGYFATDRLEDLISVIYSRVQFLLPWGLYAFDRIVEEEAKRRGIIYHNEIRLLAYLTDAGVPTFDAMRLVDLDFERVDATRLASTFQRSKIKEDVDIVGWLRVQPKESLYAIVRGPDERAIDYDLDGILNRIRNSTSHR